jgi:hypothetical protein
LKKFFVALFSFVIIAQVAFAQKPKVKNDPNHDQKLLHFGFSLGINTMDYKIIHSDYAIQNGIFVDVKELSPGINIHAIANLRLAEYFDLRTLPGISFGERYVSYADLKNNNQLIYDEGKAYKANSAYIEVPLLLKYKSARLNNFRPFLIGGGNFKYDLAQKGTYDEKEQLFMVKPFDVYGEIGFGMDFYLVYFKFAVELKYSVGLTNILRKTDNAGDPPSDDLKIYTDCIDAMHSHMFVLSFHFE